jgi:hypothetical protein
MMKKFEVRLANEASVLLRQADKPLAAPKSTSRSPQSFPKNQIGRIYGTPVSQMQQEPIRTLIKYFLKFPVNTQGGLSQVMDPLSDPGFFFKLMLKSFIQE